MKRRKLLLGIGTVAAGGTTVVGSGAFSSVQAEKQLAIALAEDGDAYLALEPTSSSNSNSFVERTADGDIAIDISGTQQAGGVNRDSVTFLDNILRVCNQGTADTSFYIHSLDDDMFPPGVSATTADGTDRLQLYRGNRNTGRSAVMGVENAVEIPLGECRELGVQIVTEDLDDGVNQLIDSELMFVGDILEEPAAGVPSLPGTPLPVHSDPVDGNQQQFDILQSTAIGTNGIELTMRKAGVDGQTTVGVQVTDYHGEFETLPITWNPGLVLAYTTVNFTDGIGSLTIGDPGVFGSTFTLFPIDGGLTSVDRIENIAVTVAGDRPDAMSISEAQIDANNVSTRSRTSDSKPFTQGEHQG